MFYKQITDVSNSADLPGSADIGSMFENGIRFLIHMFKNNVTTVLVQVNETEHRIYLLKRKLVTVPLNVTDLLEQLHGDRVYFDLKCGVMWARYYREIIHEQQAIVEANCLPPKQGSVAKAMDAVLTELEAMSPEQLRTELNKHKNGPFATALRETSEFLGQYEQEKSNGFRTDKNSS